MKIVFAIARISLAVMLATFGLDTFLKFLPEPELDGFAARYMEVIEDSYILPTISSIYIVTACLLLTNRMVALATVMTFPIAFNTVAFQMSLDPSNMQTSLVFAGLHLVVMYSRRKDFLSLFN
ncbi:hypothetical protein MLD52_01495 [Puniceicoccaceae bacterium K14]|nr:hypothetical protein [Puniceicoccaceae bacterium K14]